MYVETIGTQGFPWREGSRIARLRAYLQRRFFVVTYQRVDYAPMASERGAVGVFVLPDKPLVAPERSAGVFYAKRPHIPRQAETARKGRLLSIRDGEGAGPLRPTPLSGGADTARSVSIQYTQPCAAAF